MPDQPPILSQATAQKKFSCPSCGGEAQWNPAKQSLVCPFCGTTAPGKLEQVPGGDDVITEHDLVAALRGIPDAARGGYHARKVRLPGPRAQVNALLWPLIKQAYAQSRQICGSPLKRELVHRCQFATRTEALAAILEWIEVFYDREHLHARLRLQVTCGL